ncbi:MAG: hypothetical protein HY842_04080 [Bacteroidetes bacterium]|nr:hypothetical protein [Bacteroidota bacterium]
MEIKNLVFLLAIGTAFTLLFSNCASLTGFQTGRTVGQGNGEFLASVNVSQTPDFDYDFDDTSEVFYFTNIELSGRYGVADRFDIGLRMNTNLNVALDGRYQFLGDQESPVAVAAGFGVGTFGVFSALWNVQIPLYFSIHPTEMVAIYVSPRYTAQIAGGNISETVNYLGGNAGVLFGKKFQIGLDAGIYNLSVLGSDPVAIATFGLGVKVPFGQDD